MEFQNLVCQNCGGNSFNKIDADDYVCKHCQTLLVRTRNEQPIVKNYAPPNSAPNKQLISVVIGVVIFFSIIIAASIFLASVKKPAPITTVKSTPFQTPFVMPKMPTLQQGKLKTQIVGKVKGGFNETFIKCMVTNVGENVVQSPSVTLTLYKNDVKLGTANGMSKLGYLKPQQTVPVWVQLYDNEDYTVAKVEDEPFIRATEKPLDKLFPQLKYINAEMTTETGNSSFNGRLFKEKFYKVSGTIENDFLEKSETELYVVYYDADSNIIGISSTHPPILKKGEKAKFETSEGDKSLFGVPQKFEIIAVDSAN